MYFNNFFYTKFINNIKPLKEKAKNFFKKHVMNYKYFERKIENHVKTFIISPLSAKNKRF